MFIIARLLPHLYHFIKEVYRVDQESPISHKNRFIYRTLLTILLIVLIGLGYHDYTSITKYGNELTLLTAENVRLKNLEIFNDIERTRLKQSEEETISLRYSRDRLEVKMEIAVDLLEQVCADLGDKCSAHVNKFIQRERTIQEKGEHERNINVKQDRDPPH